MKILTFAVISLWAGSFVSAQQVSLLENEAGGVSTSAVTAGGVPQVIVPPVPAQNADAAAKPVKRIINKKKKSATLVAVSTTTVKAPADPVISSVTAPAAPAAVKPAESSAFPFEAVKPEEMPAAELAGTAAAPVKAAEAVKPAAEVKPAPAVKPVEPVKPAAEIKPLPAPKPAEPVKPPVETISVQAAKPAASAALAPAVMQSTPAVPGAGFSVGKIHTVTGGETLWGISDKYYKDPYSWGKIYNANLSSVKNPDRIYPMEELVIPDFTEEVKPESGKAPAITGGETVKEAEFTGSDVRQADEAAAPDAAAVPPAKTAQEELGDMLKEFDANDLSEEMPEHQKEWSAGVMIVPDSWLEDGVVASAEGGEEQMENSLSATGDVVLVKMKGQTEVKKGDYLLVYMKGATAYDKAGKKLGREIQRAGTLQVRSANGPQVRATVIDALTALIKGYVVKKK